MNRLFSGLIFTAVLLIGGKYVNDVTKDVQIREKSFACDAGLCEYLFSIENTTDNTLTVTVYIHFRSDSSMASHKAPKLKTHTIQIKLAPNELKDMRGELRIDKENIAIFYATESEVLAK